MHVFVAMCVATVSYQALTRTRIDRWIVLAGTVLGFAVIGTALFGSPSTLGLLASYAALVVGFAVGSAVRQIDRDADEQGAVSTDASGVQADGNALVERLEGAGFQPAPEGWLHFGRLGWNALALRRDGTNALVVSGRRRPMMELTSFLDDGHVVVTVSAASTPVDAHVLRQCFPGAGDRELLDRHHEALALVHRAGRRVTEVPDDELTERMLGAERAQPGRPRGGILGSMARGLRRKDLDVGALAERAGIVDRLRSGS